MDQLFSDYFDAQFELLKALKPEVIGHFDLINMFCVEQTFSDEVWNKVKRNIEFVISYNGLFELNSRAYKKKLPGAHPQKDTVQVRKIQNSKIKNNSNINKTYFVVNQIFWRFIHNFR